MLVICRRVPAGCIWKVSGMNEKLRARTSESTYLMYSAVRCSRRSIRSLRFSSRLSSGEPAEVREFCADTRLKVVAVSRTESNNFLINSNDFWLCRNVANFKPQDVRIFENVEYPPPECCIWKKTPKKRKKSRW